MVKGGLVIRVLFRVWTCGAGAVGCVSLTLSKRSAMC